MPDAACLSVPTESYHQPLLCCLFPQVQFHSPVSVTKNVSALLSLSVPPPTGPSVRLAHLCTDQCFQEFCFPQQRGNSGHVTDTALAGSRSCGCTQAPVAGVNLKPPRCKPAWQSCICPAWAPQSDLVAFQPFSFLPSKAVQLTSVLYSDICEPKL